MKAAVVRATGASLAVVDNWPVPQPEDLAPGEVLLKMECTGVCHTDLHAAKGDWPIPAKTPLIGGHEVRLLLVLGFTASDRNNFTGCWYRRRHWRAHPRQDHQAR